VLFGGQILPRPAIENRALRAPKASDRVTNGWVSGDFRLQSLQSAALAPSFFSERSNSDVRTISIQHRNTPMAYLSREIR
jgi:hypothetical protein